MQKLLLYALLSQHAEYQYARQHSSKIIMFNPMYNSTYKWSITHTSFHIFIERVFVMT